MKSRKEIEKEINKIGDILDVWKHRLDNIEKAVPVDDSFFADSYDILVNKSKEAIERYSIPSNRQLCSSYDRLTPLDIGASIAAGGLGAVTPKVTSELFDNIHEKLSQSNGLLGKIFNHQGEWIDTRILEDKSRVVAGPFHRFRHEGNHDLLNLSGLITSIRQFGVLKGTLKYVIHLSLDCCSRTGIPVPGTTQFLSWVKQNFGMNLFKLKGQSEFAGIRMGDFFQAGLTSGVLAIYCHLTEIPEDSLRRQQLGILGHGVSITGSAFIATQTKNLNILSKISYPACVLFAKNCWSFYRGLNTITKESERLDKEIDTLISIEPKFEVV